MFLSWFTYDTERPTADIQAILGEPGHRWLTAQGPISGNKATLDIFVTHGGVFNSGEPPVDNKKDGTIVVEFSDYKNGTVTYDITSVGRQGVVPIERIVLDNVALCEALNSE